MKFDRVLHILRGFLRCTSSRKAARNMGRVGRVACFSSFENNKVFHHFRPACLFVCSCKNYDSMSLNYSDRSPLHPSLSKSTRRAIAFIVLHSIDRPRIRDRASWGVKIETGEIESFLGQEIVVGFSQAFLDWEEATEAKGIAIGQQQTRSLVLR